MKSLEIAFPHIDKGLIGEQRQNIIDFTRTIPSTAINYFGFETPLHSENAEVDFAFNLNHNTDLWLSNDETMNTSLLHLCHSWQEKVITENYNWNNVWVEYDTSKSADKSSTPSVYLAFDTKEEIIENTKWLEEHVLLPFVQENIISTVKNEFTKVIRSCPEQVKKVQLGLMLSRNTPGIRLCLFNFQASDVLPFLKTIGWKGDTNTINSLLNTYGHLSDSLCIHLDIGAMVYPTIGTELIYENKDPWNWQPHFNKNWKIIFERLIQDKLANPEKVAQLLAFPKKETYQAPLIEKLINRTQDNVFDRYEDGDLTLGLQHIKLKIGFDNKVEAKAYFGGQFIESSYKELSSANTL